MTPKRKAIQFAVANLVHCRRVRRRDLSAKSRPPDELPTFNENYYSVGRHLIR
ncbi:MAG: hypothetical protein LBK82_05465 [Planctomycetaceae bacterium]|nr:hypothetical protein [Planctomycetaceae bacterium]